MTDEPLNFLARLKQHHLYGVVVAYAVVVGFLIQLVSRAFSYFGWTAAVPTVIIVLLLGFPVVVVLAWLFIKSRDPAKSDTWQRRHWKLSAAVTVVVIVLVVISGFYGVRFSEHRAERLATASAIASEPKPAITTAPPVTNVIPAKSIAVLPFENLSDDKNNAYFADGIQDLILTKLADIGDLKVISRTSTMQYGSHPENLIIVGQQLGVATLLEGSVQKVVNQVLVNVQLIDAKTDTHIWAQSYQRTLDNVFGVEGEVAEQIATTLNAKLSPAETKRLATRLSSNPAANDLFLRAEYFANQGDINYDTATWKQAIPLYKEVIVQAPDFALARARMSFVESTLAFFGGGGEDVQQLTTDARNQAEQALALAPDLAEAHLAIGFSDYWGRGDYTAALKAFAAALAFSPNDTTALSAQGYVLRRQGHFNVAIGLFQKAIALDPRNSSLAFELGQTYMLAGRYREAEQAFQRALALNPHNEQAKNRYALSILYGRGDISRALTAMQGTSSFLQLQRVGLLTLQRSYRAALTLLDGIPDTQDNFSFGGSKTLQKADLYRLMGDHAQAQLLFQKALPEARGQLAAQASSDINLALVWSNVADAELGLGHTPAALVALTKSQALIERSGDHVYGPVQMQGNAALYAEVGRANLAVSVLAEALATPGIGADYSPVLLWLDPAWDPIRNDPQFQALLKKYAKYKPAVIPAPVPSVSADNTHG